MLPWQALGSSPHHRLWVPIVFRLLFFWQLPCESETLSLTPLGSCCHSQGGRGQGRMPTSPAFHHLIYHCRMGIEVQYPLNPAATEKSLVLTKHTSPCCPSATEFRDPDHPGLTDNLPAKEPCKLDSSGQGRNDGLPTGEVRDLKHYLCMLYSGQKE